MNHQHKNPLINYDSPPRTRYTYDTLPSLEPSEVTQWDMQDVAHSPKDAVTFGPDSAKHFRYDTPLDHSRPTGRTSEYKIVKSLGAGVYGSLRLEEETRTKRVRVIEVVRKKSSRYENTMYLNKILDNIEADYKYDARVGDFQSWFEDDDSMFFAMYYEGTM